MNSDLVTNATEPVAPPRSALAQLADWAAALRFDMLPARVAALAGSQVLSQLASIRAGAEHPLGQRLMTAFGPALQEDGRQSACVLAGLGSWLNLDDTAYAGHLSNSTVAVPLAFARATESDGQGLLTAVVAANECAARVTAAATLGPLRGHTAAHTHLIGAVAGRLHCEGASADVWLDAFGLALGMPPWPLMRAFLASDARLFNTFGPVRTAMDACDAARAGLHGAHDIVEHQDGFLARFASVPLVDAITAGLGDQWHTETLSFKMHPGGPGIDAAIDCAMLLWRELGERAAEIVDVEVAASLYTLLSSKRAARYVDGAASPLGALVLDTSYPVATALLTGAFTVRDFAEPAVSDPKRWALARRVRLVHDPAMTRQLFDSVAPFGEAVRMAGPRAAVWIREFGGDDLVALVGGPDGLAGAATDFRVATKATPARVTVRLADGDSHVRELTIPVGAAGPDLRAGHRELVREKFLELGGPADVADAVGELPSMDQRALRDWITAALA
jgi:2-methylcitrate dehydratase PrpD